MSNNDFTSFPSHHLLAHIFPRQHRLKNIFMHHQELKDIENMKNFRIKEIEVCVF